MLFKWIDFRGIKFVHWGNGSVRNIRDAHDLAEYNRRLGDEMVHMRGSLVETERKSRAFLASVASHIPVPPPRLKKPIF